jgi:hypothetical protein
MLQQNEVDNSFVTFERSPQMGVGFDTASRDAGPNDLAITNRQSGNYAEAMVLMWESLALARRLTPRHGWQRSATWSCCISMSGNTRGGADRGGVNCGERAQRRRVGVAIDQLNYTAAILKSEGPEAGLTATPWADHIASFGDKELTIDLAELGASIYAGFGTPELAARLLGSADSQRDRSAMRRSQGADSDRRVDRARPVHHRPGRMGRRVRRRPGAVPRRRHHASDRCAVAQNA